MNCRPGDLAVIVKSEVPENLGLFVDVIESFEYGMFGPFYLIGEPKAWYCRAKGVIKYTNVMGEQIFVGEGPIPDECLRPIRPPGQDTSTTTPKDLEVTA